MLSIMRILIVKLSSIGDIVHTLPALASLKKALPKAEFFWVAEESAAAILRNNPVLSRLIEVDTRSLRRKSVLGKTIKTAARQFRDLRASDFDLAIDFQGLFKSATISRISGAPVRAGFSKSNLREPSCRHIYTDIYNVDDGLNVIVKNKQLAQKAVAGFLKDKSFSLDMENHSFPIERSEQALEEASGLHKKTDGNFAILNPAGGWETKLWPAENYGRLADLLWRELRLRSIICTAPNELDLAKRAEQASRSAGVLTATPSLKGFYELAKSAAVYVGGDTAPTHLAVAAECPVVGILGPTEWWRNGSPVAEDVCVERNEIDCREDCHRRKCDNWICMDISVETVFAGVESRLNPHIA
jgi:lipopolysaccharide heptosyltransferase I